LDTRRTGGTFAFHISGKKYPQTAVEKSLFATNNDQKLRAKRVFGNKMESEIDGEKRES